MGCDIHTGIEIRTHSHWWYHSTAWFPDRNYEFFEILAGVRGRGRDIPPIAKPRGVPPDASGGFMDFVERYRGDGHSHSYLLLSEVLAYAWKEKTGKEAVDYFGPYLALFIALAEKAGGPDNLRLVFFFDN